MVPPARGRAGLTVWLGTRRVADLVEPRSRQLTLQYTPDAVAHYGVGGIALSASLPVRGKPYTVGETRPFLEGLLPEGEARTRIEQVLDVPRGDVYRLLQAIGGDCAGAVTILPPGREPVTTLQGSEPIGDEVLAEEVAALPDRPLGVSGNVRLSLAGMMDKLLLVRLPGGRWARPVGGAPSTHILKPEPARFPGLATLEAYGLALANAAGASAPDAELLDLAEVQRPILAVTRYDRVVDGSGVVRRVHQEDFCQALGRLPDAKYEAEGGPSFAEVAEAIRRLSTAPRLDLQALVRAMTITAAVGNADAHGRNLAMLYDRDERRLAPLYDVIPTLAVAPLPGHRGLSTSMAIRVNGCTDLLQVSGRDLVAEAASWRVPERLVRETVGDSLERLRDGAEPVAQSLAAPDATVLTHAVDRVCNRAKSLLAGR